MRCLILVVLYVKLALRAVALINGVGVVDAGVRAPFFGLPSQRVDGRIPAFAARCIAASALLGYRRSRNPLATLAARQLGLQHYALRIDYPDGEHRDVEIAGDQWQLDARVIKWEPRAVMLGAPPLYRVERISGRYIDAAQANERRHSIVVLEERNPFDLLDIKRRFPAWLPWVDADYGSAAYLPLVDGGEYRVSLAPAGGLVARPADARTEQLLHDAGW
jgi:hypothetical protein